MIAQLILESALPSVTLASHTKSKCFWLDFIMKRFTSALSLLFIVGATVSLRADTSVVFNEIMYHPSTNETTMEWVEFYNQMAVDVDISGWSVTGGIQYTFPSDTIVRGGGYLLLALSPETMAALTGLTNVCGPFAGRLSNSGEELQLCNNSGRIVDTVSYGVDGDWPVAPNGSGESLAKRDRDTAVWDPLISDARRWLQTVPEFRWPSGTATLPAGRRRTGP